MAGEIAYIALGANLGDPVAMLCATVKALAQLHSGPGSRFKPSGLYRSAPVDALGPDYFNAVVQLTTCLSPQALLGQLQALEQSAGRVRSTVNAPRTLDLDLLLCGSAQMQTPELTLPHPRMHQRAFVLRPLLDLGAGDLIIPGHGTVAGLEHLTRDQRIEKICAPWEQARE